MDWTAESIYAQAMAEQSTHAVQVLGLKKSYGQQPALTGLDLSIARGECVGLLGPNGAGKTTALKIISTLCSADEGQVDVYGFDPATQGQEVRRRIGVVPQEIALYPDLTAEENLAFFGKIYGVPSRQIKERVNWGIEASGLSTRKSDKVHAFSGGMQRRLNIVAALLHEPELCLLDEPTVGVDPQSRNHIFEMIAQMNAGGMSLLYTTHQMGEVERLCDRIVIMDHGRSVATGSLSELRQASQHKGLTSHGLQLEDPSQSSQARGILQAAGIAIVESDDTLGLEEIFLTLTGHALRDETD